MILGVWIATGSTVKTYKNKPDPYKNSGIRTQSSQKIEQTSSRNSENRTYYDLRSWNRSSRILQFEVNSLFFFLNFSLSLIIRVSIFKLLIRKMWRFCFCSFGWIIQILRIGASFRVTMRSVRVHWCHCFGLLFVS